MNYTEKYHLPQWEENDRVMRMDFNQMCDNIESGIDGAKAQAAQSDAALEVKVAKAAELPYVLGTYRGNGGTLKVTLGFKPSAVIVGKPHRFYSAFPLLITRESNLSEFAFENDGFTVIRPEGGNSVFHLNEEDSFLYIAFR